VRARLQRVGQQRPLDFGGQLKLAFDSRLLGGLAVQPALSIAEAAFARDRFERAARRRRHQLALLAAVEIQHADRTLIGFGRPSLHDTGRLAAACTGRGECRAPLCRDAGRQIPVRKSATIRSWPVANTSCGIFWLVSNDFPETCHLARARGRW
jgi:hypothetical protein